jgi:Uma2 family endonuclease
MPQAAVGLKLTVAEYLERERGASEKSIYWDGDVYVMAGAKPAHNLVVAAVLRVLGNALLGSPRRPYSSDQRIRVPGANRYVYPDVSVTCRPVEYDKDDPATICNPSAIFEVLSEGTEKFDVGEKFASLRVIPSLTDYVFLSQREERIEHYQRNPDDSWTLRTYHAGECATLASLGVTLDVSNVYLGVFDA